MLVYALDIGGSSVKHAVVRLDMTSPLIVERRPDIDVQTRQFSDLREAVLASLGLVLRDHPQISLVGISTTGTVSREGVVLNAGHFEDYRNIDWHRLLTSAHPSVRDVTTVNDGRAATWAEYMVRSFDCTHFCHFVVGTGVGGAAVVRGQLVLGDDGNAGNFGHWRVTQEETIKCSCGKRGCLETVASAPAIVADYIRRGASTGRSAQDVPAFRDIVDFARSGDEDATAAFRSAGQWLGVGMGVAINFLNPRHITIGGGVAAASSTLQTEATPDPFLGSAVASARDCAHRRPGASVSISPATYGNDGGMIGAAILAARPKGHS